MERPDLDKNLDSKTFRSFYFLKEELVNFCRENGLPTSGGKIEITDRIAHFLDTGKIVSVSRERKATVSIGDMDLYTKIEPNFVCTEKHRAFFKVHIGPTFSFNAAFQKWLKTIQVRLIMKQFRLIIKSSKKRKQGKRPLTANLSIIPMFVISLRITKENL